MFFEYLANELILDIFEYLSVSDLFRAFFGLNTHFNQLLTQFKFYRLDLRSISKENFQLLCQKYLPLVPARILSLHLSNHEETPNLPKLFLSSTTISIHQFIHLQSLSLSYIQSFDILDAVIRQCEQLIHFAHLYFIKCYFNYPEYEIQSLMNQIWKLPALTHCLFDQITSRKFRLTTLSTRSSSIKSLAFEKITCDFDDLLHLFKHTPHLQRLSLNLVYGFPNQHFHLPFDSIQSLKILYHGCRDSLINLFENLPQLIHLTLETFDIYCDGFQWEDILLTSLVRLRRFQLKMNLNFPDYHQIDQQANDLLETFRTPFWIDQHQWFVRCDWDRNNVFRNGILYTLPYAFNDCFYFDAMSSISTCPTTDDYWSYDHVRMLSHGNPENDLGKELILFSARFGRIRHLKISFPFEENFWSCLSSFNYLTSINVTLLPTELAYVQLQNLLHRALHLYSLKLSYSADLPVEFFAMTSPSIRRLNFLKNSQPNIRSFTTNQCFLLLQSPLIRQCEVLLIALKNHWMILPLIKTMNNLRSLTCHCQDDDFYAWNCSASSSMKDDALIEWLRTQLPSTYSILRDEKQTHLIRIWIG